MFCIQTVTRQILCKKVSELKDIAYYLESTHILLYSILIVFHTDQMGLGPWWLEIVAR